MEKILLVDDNEKIISCFKKLLSEFTVLEAVNGFEGIQMYETHHPKVVIMDLQMPVMNGIETIKAIHKMDSEAKIIVLTAQADIKNAEILAAGASKIFIKPIQKDVLLNLIREELIRYIHTAFFTFSHLF